MGSMAIIVIVRGERKEERYLEMATPTNPLHGEDHHDRQNATQNNSAQRSEAIDPSEIPSRGELDESIGQIDNNITPCPMNLPCKPPRNDLDVQKVWAE